MLTDVPVLPQEKRAGAKWTFELAILRAMFRGVNDKPHSSRALFALPERSFSNGVQPGRVFSI